MSDPAPSPDGDAEKLAARLEQLVDQPGLITEASIMLRAQAAELAQVTAARDAMASSLSRIRAAIKDVPPPPPAEMLAAIASDHAGGLSLRHCARKHGVSLGAVRGAVRRAQRDAGR